MKVIKSLFKLFWILICIGIIVGVHVILFYLNSQYIMDNSVKTMVSGVIIISCIFLLVIYLKFKKLTMIFSIFGYYISGVVTIAICFFPTKLLLGCLENEAQNETPKTIIIVIAVIFCLYLLWLYTIYPLFKYIKDGGDIVIHNSNPYNYGTPEYELRELNNKLDDINRYR